MKYLITTLTLIATTIFIVLSSSFFVIYNDDFYLRECKRLNTDCEESLNILKYLENKKPLSEEFTDREVSHMKDVKDLITKIKIFYFLVIALLIFLMLINILETKNIFKFLDSYLIYSGIFSFFFILLFILVSFIKFDIVFDLFHELFFKTGTWIFNENDLLIRLFSIKFFIDALIFILSISLVISLIFVLIGFILKRFK